MTSAADFAATYGPKGFSAWEARAVELARAGDFAAWPLAPVTFTDSAGRKLVAQAATDYFAVGTRDACLRLPLTPTAAQQVADALGMTLPTPMMVKILHDQAAVKVLSPPLAPNNGASMAQYGQHSTACDSVLRSSMGLGLRDGLKKDVVIGNLWKPKRVLIYGWVKPGAGPGKDPAPGIYVDWRIQPYSNVHGDFYVDYSHGARLWDREATLDGAKIDLVDVMKDPALAGLLSWEGALRQPRYPTPSTPATRSYRSLLVPSSPSLADVGRQVVIDGSENSDRKERDSS